MAPASWRYGNPGAQYPGPVSRRWGGVQYGTIGDGHKIAQFDDPLKGAAAQFDLLGSNYSGMTINDAIRKWSGGNSWQQYASKVARDTGVDPNEKLTIDRIRDPNFAVPFAKSMSKWEAGRDYPMSDAQWAQAHRMYLGGGGAVSTAPHQQQEPTVNAFAKPENGVTGFGTTQPPDDAANAFSSWGSDHYGRNINWASGGKSYV